MPATATKPNVKKKSIPKAKNPGPKRRIDDAHSASPWKAEFVTMSIDDILVVENERREFDPDALRELADSIAKTGVLEPLLVTPHATEDGFQLIAGERRLRASAIANLRCVPVRIFRSVDDGGPISEVQIATIRLTENLQRRDLNAVERARGVARLVELMGGQKQAAKELGWTAGQVSSSLGLLELPEPWLGWVAAKKLSWTAVRPLRPLAAKRPQVLQRLVDVHSAEIDEGEFALTEWKIASAVSHCQRPMELAAYYEYSAPSASRCWFEPTDAERKLLDIEVGPDDREYCWNVELWEELNKPRLKEARAKYQEDLKKRTPTKNSGNDAAESKINLVELEYRFAKQLAVRLADGISQSYHKTHLPLVLVFMLQAELYDFPLTLTGKVNGKFPSSDDVADMLSGLTTKQIAPKLFAAMKKYFGELWAAESSYVNLLNLSEVTGVAKVLELDLTVDWQPNRAILEVYPEDMLRTYGMKICGIKHADQPDSLEDVIAWLLEDWPAGTLLPETQKLLRGR